ncbi:hypothetical protein JX265_011976 [Neoarthrinium moseri]|uniref:Glycosyl transferase CAP10 domain-containing protein n=1 Tax=Neoarthrinium moseri TaxID=1658444 RepID=A0A9P9WAX6_9PEZI|nr:hypothetical protein JX265_011976 [Neoarthrinium moseri]
MGIIIASRLRIKYLAIAATLLGFIIYFIIYQQQDAVYGAKMLPSLPKWLKNSFSSGEETPKVTLPPWQKPDNHPISELIDAAQTHVAETLKKRSWSVENAARRYRERRGRHPPPGFDAWFEAAKEKNAIVVEEFFDRVYHDINPFWAMDPLEMRRQAHEQPELIRVRDGKVSVLRHDPGRVRWPQLWSKLLEEMVPHLPDLDMAINILDESRILVPWENITDYVATERRSRGLFPAHEALVEYADYSDLDENPVAYEPEWIYDVKKYWDYFTPTCPPDSPARQFKSLSDYGENVTDLYPTEPLHYTHRGFIQNFTASQDACIQPHLRGMHGSFVESGDMRTLTQLFPMFGGSKLPQNNEILIPGAMYLTDKEFYSGGSGHGGPWSEKTDSIVWRGAASGGKNNKDDWFHFQRHRFIQMMNGTTVAQVEAGETEAGPSFELLQNSMYNVSAQEEGKLGPWLDKISDVGFSRLDCFPEVIGLFGKKLVCPYIEPYMHKVESKTMSEQYNYKYLPDVDGNSFSARWRGFLLSSSCPLKSTIYTEWHDDRLIPWLHFVPFDNSYMDIYAIMDYFLNGHDAQAQRIAQEGAEWAQKVLRREDMMLYTWRVLLEYARVVDPNRDRLGYVKDLVQSEVH